jgi:hypothetical protein
VYSVLNFLKKCFFFTLWAIFYFLACVCKKTWTKPWIAYNKIPKISIKRQNVLICVHFLWQSRTVFFWFWWSINYDMSAHWNTSHAANLYSTLLLVGKKRTWMQCQKFNQGRAGRELMRADQSRHARRAINKKTERGWISLIRARPRCIIKKVTARAQNTECWSIFCVVILCNQSTRIKLAPASN